MYTFKVIGVNDMPENEIIVADMYYLHELIKKSETSIRKSIDMFCLQNIINFYRCFPSSSIIRIFYDFAMKVKGDYQSEEK